MTVLCRACFTIVSIPSCSNGLADISADRQPKNAYYRNEYQDQSSPSTSVLPFILWLHSSEFCKIFALRPAPSGPRLHRQAGRRTRRVATRGVSRLPQPLKLVHENDRSRIGLSTGDISVLLCPRFAHLLGGSNDIGSSVVAGSHARLHELICVLRPGARVLTWAA